MNPADLVLALGKSKISVAPWKSEGRCMVTIRPWHPQLGKLKRDRRVVENLTERQAVEWGKRRLASILGEALKPPPTADELAAKQAEEDASGETVDEYAKRWAADRQRRKIASWKRDLGRYTKWVAPTVGRRPVKLVTSDELRAIVELLDDAVSDGTIAWRTAWHAWGIVTKLFGSAKRSKTASLRVRKDNPSADVEGPERGEDRVGPYLFPSEFVRLITCKRVPVRWKRLIVFATYLYVRRGELAALDWASVDLERGYVSIHEAVGDDGLVKTTKTNDTRKVAIEPTLLPLLRVLREEAGGDRAGGRVFAMPPREQMARRLRKYVQWAHDDAGVALRADLLADDAVRRRLSWHDLRHTGITWRAVRGDDPMKIQRGAGHSDFAMTNHYIAEAQNFEDRSVFGLPFPPLRQLLVSAASQRRANAPAVGARRSA
ncbi:MAG: site-specific integrase [Labilithrix sp.]|nr:site-specific integrase [Labilithrix sp.]